jgi:hypothetical protein
MALNISSINDTILTNASLMTVQNNVLGSPINANETTIPPTIKITSLNSINTTSSLIDSDKNSTTTITSTVYTNSSINIGSTVTKQLNSSNTTIINSETISNSSINANEIIRSISLTVTSLDSIDSISSLIDSEKNSTTTIISTDYTNSSINIGYTVTEILPLLQNFTTTTTNISISKFGNYDFEWKATESPIANVEYTLNLLFNETQSKFNLDALLCKKQKPLMNNLNNSISRITDLCNIINKVNTTELDIISYWKKEVLICFREISLILSNVSILLNDIFNKQINTNDDVSLLISDFKKEINTSICLYSNIRKIQVKKYINNNTFPKTFQMFNNIISMVYKIENILQKNLANKAYQLSENNNYIVSLKKTNCHLNESEFIDQLFLLTDINRGFNQITYLFNSDHFIYNEFINYRYKIFLSSNYNVSLSQSVNLITLILDNLYSILIELNNSLGLINSNLNLTTFQDSLNVSISKVTNYINNIPIAFQQEHNGVKNIINILEYYLNYTQFLSLTIENQTTLLNNSTTKLEQPYLISNITIGTKIVNTASDNLNNINIPDSSKFVSNVQSFSNQLISFKSLTQNSFLPDLENMIKQAIMLNSSIYSQSQYFNYISSSVDTISETDRNISMIISNSLFELTNYLDSFKITFTNLSLEVNSTNYFNVDVNQTIVFTQKFINFTQLLFSDIQTVNNIFSTINSSLNKLKGNLLTGLNDIYNSLMFVYTTTTTTTTSTTTIATTTLVTTTANNLTVSTVTMDLVNNTNEWNYWQPWLFCQMFRQRRNLITNEIMSNYTNVSCSLISKFFFILFD